jgi:hypothetical protein
MSPGINNAKIPAGSLIGYKLVRAGKIRAKLQPLVANVERWARDNVGIAKTKEVSKTFEAGDWTIKLDLYSGDDGAAPPSEAIGATQIPGEVIAPHKDLRDALEDKNYRYGALDKPYLIAVADGKDQLFGKSSIHSALSEAVFGDEIAQFKDGVAEIIHAKNGFWHGPKGPRNRHVSGVILLPETGLWKLRDEKWQPVLAVNPWADRPLPDMLRIIAAGVAENPSVLPFQSRFGRDAHMRTQISRGERLSDDFLRVSKPVDGRGIDEIDAALDRRPERGNRLSVVGSSPHPATYGPCTQSHT